MKSGSQAWAVTGLAVGSEAGAVRAQRRAAALSIWECEQGAGQAQEGGPPGLEGVWRSGVRAEDTAS